MNLQEFAVLKAGDKINNDMTASQGEVLEVVPMGVRVRWGVASQPGGRDMSFVYTVQSTAWFHWSKAPQSVSAELAEDLSKRAT